jgi:hypothetical protein
VPTMSGIWWARCALPTLPLGEEQTRPHSRPYVGWAKEHSDVPTMSQGFGGHAALCPPYIIEEALKAPVPQPVV